MNEKTEWESFVQIWDKNDLKYQEHNNLYWTVCYEKNCTTYKLKKQEEYYFQASKKYCKKKNEMSNLKYEKVENNVSSKQTF